MRSSLVLVTYNGLGYLETCLRALQQNIMVDDEVIVVDNASSDGSADYVRSVWPTLCLIENHQNMGFAAACNQGAQHARGRNLVFLNQDTEVLSGWLAGLVNALEQSSIALATSRLLLMRQPEKLNACGLEVHFSGLTFQRGFMEPADRYTEVASVCAVSGASFAIRRDIWERLGGFDECLGMYFEETDLSWRAQLAGYRCLYIPESMVYHDQALQPSVHALYYSARNRYILLLKNWRWLTLLLLMPGLMLAELVDWGYLLLLGRAGLTAKFQAYGWLLTNLPKILRARQCAQSTRQVSDHVLLEQCAFRLSPTLVTGGLVGRIVIQLCNVLFRANYWMALRLCRPLSL